MFGQDVDPRIADALADVAETLVQRDPPVAGALRRMGGTLGADGWPLPRVHHWVVVAASTLPRRHRRRLTDLAATGHLARGWAAEHLRGVRSATCIDAITGLVTPLVLAAHMHEAAAVCRVNGVDATDRHAVLVADLDLLAVPHGDRHAVLITAAALLTSLLPDDTVARCEGRLVALLDRDRITDVLLDRIRNDLDLLVCSARPFVWTDAVPSVDAHIDAYVRALSEPFVG